ncbi:XdhC family protein [Litoribrevibacter euphylliae]|uniref:XdhC family protein n=1 Tax=Litoribrevibacter euphylliae TaxID=1834034 RepID=A0ABV7HGZ5_9GAMM
MANHISHLLSIWIDRKDQTEWVLGTVVRTQGSSYRKAGAMMLFSGEGDQWGLLSGGCLESDIQRHARKVMLTGQPKAVTYDGNDEDDISFQLGIGCGGVVDILLQPITKHNDYLALEHMHHALASGKGGVYFLDTRASGDGLANQFQANDQKNTDTGSPSGYLLGLSGYSLPIPVKPRTHLLIIGGGVDARPLAHMASELGWQTTVWDPRPANARPNFFESVDHLLRHGIDCLSQHLNTYPVDAAVVMSHSITLDSSAVEVLAPFELNYLAMLGPVHRRQQVLDNAGINTSDRFQRLARYVAGPAGLDLGGELPENIALSILAECQAVLEGRSAQSLSLTLVPEERLTKQLVSNG